MEKIRQIKRILTGMLAAALILPCGLTATAYDDTQGHWAEETIEKWSTEYSVLGGYGDGTFRPDHTITRGAFAGILCRFLGYWKEAPADTFSDTTGSRWESDILKLNAAGVYLGNDGLAQIGNSISRQQAMTMICRALQIPESEGEVPYADAGDVAGYARKHLAALTERGCITDVGEDNRFRPTDPITRAEVVNLLDKIVFTVVREYREFSDMAGNLLITAREGAYLKKAVIYGDLIIGPGVKGTVKLEEVNLMGEIRNLGDAVVEVMEPKPPVYEHTQTEILYNGEKIPVKRELRPSTLGPGDFRWENGRLICTNPNFTVRFGIDVSRYQCYENVLNEKGEIVDTVHKPIDWEAVAADGVEFAMVRVGSRGTSQGLLYTDTNYAENIDGAMAAGIDTGVYIFSQAITVEEAIEEADFVIELLDGHPISGPVAFDWEMLDSSYRVFGIDPAVATACAKAFCERVEEAGYQAMIYCSKYVGYKKMDLGTLRDYPIWYPEYRYTTNTEAMLFPSFYYQVSVWQYSDSLTVNGISGPVDGNLWLIPVN